MGDDLDRLSEVFAEFMTPDEDGTPLLDIADLGNALEQAGIPRELAGTLGPRMDAQKTGQIGFEDFVNVCMDAAHPENTSKTEFKGDFAFHLLANKKKQRITVNSLRRASKKLHFNTSQEDLTKMIELASTKEEFANVWRNLNM